MCTTNSKASENTATRNANYLEDKSERPWQRQDEGNAVDFPFPHFILVPGLIKHRSVCRNHVDRRIKVTGTGAIERRIGARAAAPAAALFAYPARRTGMKLKAVVSSLLAVGALATGYAVVGQNAAPLAARDLNTCCAPADQDWPTVSGNLGQQSYTSLSQITKANIGNLGPAWITHISAVPATVPTASAGTTTGGQQTSPIAVDGVVYSETPDGDVVAVDGTTGAVKWKWHPTTANSGFGPTGTRRGLSVGGGRVYTLAAGNRIVALDQNTGAQIWAVVPPPPAGETTLGNVQKAATIYYNGKVYIGTNDAGRNAAFAVDAATGAMAWTAPFYGGAKPGMTVTDVNGRTWFAGDTWMCATDGSTACPSGTPQNTCALTAGASSWIHGSIDPALNTIYIAFGNVRSCGSSQDASTRPGTNLFGNSLVALDATTGAYKWHFQSNLHGQWDMDNTHNPTQADVTINGQPRKVIYYGTKQGRTFVIDRVTGLPVLPVEYRTVVQDSRTVRYLAAGVQDDAPRLPAEHRQLRIAHRQRGIIGQHGADASQDGRCPRP